MQGGGQLSLPRARRLTAGAALGTIVLMIITLKSFATLHKYMPENPDAYEVPEGLTVQELLGRLGLEDEQVKLVFINGAHVSREAVISGGDRVGLFPAVGGG